MGEDRYQSDIKTIVQSVVSELKVDPRNSEAGVHWTIKVFGSAILVLSVSLMAGLFQNLYGHVYDLHTQMNGFISKEEMNNIKMPMWNAIKSIQDKEIQGISNTERLKLTEERLKRVEDDNNKLREQVMGLNARLEAVEKSRRSE